MTTIEQSGGDAADLRLPPKSPDLGLDQVLQGVDALDYNQGVCSTRVQGIIFEVHKTEKQPKTITIGDPATQLHTTAPVFGIGRTDYDEWRLFADETGEPGEVQQTIYVAKANTDGEWQAIPLFKMLEKANDTGCSVSLCLPAADATDLEWGVICTSADEARPVTVDESLKDIPQTNAEVLDKLMLVLKGERDLAQLDLVETLHVEELHQRAFPKKLITERFAQPSTETQRTLLAKKLRAIGAWTVLAATQSSQSAPLKEGQSLRYTPLSPDSTQVDRVTSNLGTTERVMPLGHITHPKDEAPLFVADPEIESHFTDRSVYEIIAKAAQSYEIPDVQTDPEVTAAINDLIANLIANVRPAEHAEMFNARLDEIIKQWKNKDGSTYNTKGINCLDLGILDISSLGKGVYMGSGLSLQTLRFRAQVLANKAQSVFVGGNSSYPIRIFDCSVEGAVMAFENVVGYDLYAKDCHSAFINSQVQRSVAQNAKRAFEGGFAIGCIAQSCDVAFDNLLVEHSMAIDCGQAFTELHTDSRDLTLELSNTKRGKYFTEWRKRFGFSLDKAILPIPKEERQERNMVVKNPTRRSIINSYRAGKRFGK